MKIHELALFWRDTTTRCFTFWHFLPAPPERALTRASQILALLQKLSTLQLYGAVLDGEAVRLNQAKPAPASGTEVRLTANLYPAKPINPREGITYLKFSIPGPLPQLIDVVESQRFSHPDWLFLDKECFSFLCLPNGTGVKQKERLYRAEIDYLDQKKRPQPGQPPLQAAISRTTEDLDIARKSWQKLKTEHEKIRVEKYQARLDALFTWQYLEKACCEQIETLQLLEPAPTLVETALVKESSLKATPVVAAELSSLPQAPATTASSSHFNDQSIQKEEAIAMTDPQPQTTAQAVAYLPAPLCQDQAWQDVPAQHWLDSTMWLYRDQIKRFYNLSERTFFRWIDNLKQYGLTRWLPAQGKPLLRLYYKPDIETAVEKFQAATQAAPGRPHKGLSALSQQAGSPQPSPGPARTSQQAEMLAPATPVPERAAAVELLAATVATLQKQQISFEQTIAQLHQRIDSLAQQFQHQAQQKQQVDTKDEILAAFNKLARKILRRTPSPNPQSAKPRKARKTKPPRSSAPNINPSKIRTSSRAKAPKASSLPKQKSKTPKSKIKQKATKPIAKKSR